MRRMILGAIFGAAFGAAGAWGALFLLAPATSIDAAFTIVAGAAGAGGGVGLLVARVRRRAR